MAGSSLLAGVAAGDITPPLGVHMGGYWGRRSGATAVHDPLTAKALAFSGSTGQAVVVALDLVGLDAATVARMRARIEARAQIPASACMICCSHTHAGPLTASFRGMGEVDAAYLQRVADTVVELAAAAVAAAQPVSVRHARVPVQVGVNRRETTATGVVLGRDPAGPVVPYAHVVALDTAAGPLATLFSHACHGVVLGGSNHSISADFAGAAARHLEAHTGAPAAFVNGACGDINPRRTGATFAEVEELGVELGEAVIGGRAQAGGIGVEPVRAASRGLDLPLCPLPSRLHAEAEHLVLQLKSELQQLRSGGHDVWAQRVPQARLEWAEALLAEVRGSRPQQASQPFEVQVIRVGDLALLGLEGEIFARYQLELEAASPLPATILCGYANGCTGYVPTADEYARGGYEVEMAYQVYPSVRMIAPASEAMIRRAASELLAEVAA